jgi:hypothetical protein
MTRNSANRATLGCLVILATIMATLAGCAEKQTMEALTPPPSVFLSPAKLTLEPATPTKVQPTPTLFVPGKFINSNLDLKAGPEDTPLELLIPALKVSAPIMAVGLTTENVMDAPKGDIGDPIWSSAFWYRGSGIPGDPNGGTATIAAHVNDPLGRPEIFANLQELQPGDLIIIQIKNTSLDMHFMVDTIKVYSVQESSDPAVLAQIYGPGPASGTAPLSALDGLAHLTLITCAGYIVNGEFDHHTVVFATRSK